MCFCHSCTVSGMPPREANVPCCRLLATSRNVPESKSPCSAYGHSTVLQLECSCVEELVNNLSCRDLWQRYLYLYIHTSVLSGALGLDWTLLNSVVNWTRADCTFCFVTSRRTEYRLPSRTASIRCHGNVLIEPLSSNWLFHIYSLPQMYINFVPAVV
jgi:hypothetical protein